MTSIIRYPDGGRGLPSGYTPKPPTLPPKYRDSVWVSQEASFEDWMRSQGYRPYGRRVEGRFPQAYTGPDGVAITGAPVDQLRKQHAESYDPSQPLVNRQDRWGPTAPAPRPVSSEVDPNRPTSASMIAYTLGRPSSSGGISTTTTGGPTSNTTVRRPTPVSAGSVARRRGNSLAIKRGQGGGDVGTGSASSSTGDTSSRISLEPPDKNTQSILPVDTNESGSPYSGGFTLPNVRLPEGIIPRPGTPSPQGAPTSYPSPSQGNMPWDPQGTPGSNATYDPRPSGQGGPVMGWYQPPGSVGGASQWGPLNLAANPGVSYQSQRSGDGGYTTGYQAPQSNFGTAAKGGMYGASGPTSGPTPTSTVMQYRPHDVIQQGRMSPNYQYQVAAQRAMPDAQVSHSAVQRRVANSSNGRNFQSNPSNNQSFRQNMDADRYVNFRQGAS